MKKFNAIFSALLIISMAACGKDKAQPDSITISIRNILGSVKVKSKDKGAPAKAGQVLLPGDRLITGSASLADIMYGDRGVIRISENSEFRIDKIAGIETGNTDLNLEKGRMQGVLKKLGKTGVHVKTPTIVASVRGTTFSIAADKKSSRVAVVKGRIQVRPVNLGKVIIKVAVFVEEKQSIKIDRETTKKIAEGKGPKLAAEPIKREEIVEIQDALTDMKPELIKELDEEVKKEIKENAAIDTKVEKKPSPPRISKADLLKKKEEELALKAAEEERIRKEREERERLEEIKRIEQEKRDKVSNIPTL